MNARLTAIALCAFLLLNGCSSNQTQPNTTAEDAQSLYQQLGGAEGVARLADQWGMSIARHSELNMILDSAATDDVEAGFTNDVMKASGMIPGTTATLANALAGKGLTEMHVAALSATLREAGALLGINAGVMSTVAATIVEPAARSVMGMR
jgi:hypothetical protein